MLLVESGGTADKYGDAQVIPAASDGSRRLDRTEEGQPAGGPIHPFDRRRRRRSAVHRHKPVRLASRQEGTATRASVLVAEPSPTQRASRSQLAPGWQPRFGDYLYLGLTNSIAFSPTDAMPLAMGAKAAMALESLISLAIVSLVIARAVNVF